MTDSFLKLTKSNTWLDRLPAEIILEIFDYLSSNDIIYTFFYFNQRLNSLLIDHQRYFSNLELSTSNFDFWQNNLSIINSNVQSLNITIDHFSVSLNLFPNLTSLILSSPYALVNGQLQSVLESDQFKKLSSLKIKTQTFIKKRFHHSSEEDYIQQILTKVFRNENKLRTFEYLSIDLFYPGNYNNCFQVNYNIRSLTLDLPILRDVFAIIQFTPNIKYLNVIIGIHLFSETFDGDEWLIKINHIQLKKLYLTLYGHVPRGEVGLHEETVFLQINQAIKPFSSSLICLSLNLINFHIYAADDLPLNGIKLQEKVLKSMIQLKTFYFYAKIHQNKIDMDRILLTFRNQFWFDNHWLIGMHQNYLYSLPFQFEHLEDFSHFDNVVSNNDDILKTNPWLWYNVTSIELSRTFNIDLLKLIKSFKIKMPKLSLIKINENSEEIINDSYVNANQIDVRLDNVTTLHIKDRQMKCEKQLLIFTLPNLKHLILDNTKFPSSKSQLASILQSKIERLDIFNCEYQHMEEANYIYFSNLQDIRITFKRSSDNNEFDQRANIIMKLLKNINNLKTLSLFTAHWRGGWYSAEETFETTVIIKRLDLDEIKTHYKMIYHANCIHFSKKMDEPHQP